jgi:hypothetical protein
MNPCPASEAKRAREAGCASVKGPVLDRPDPDSRIGPGGAGAGGGDGEGVAVGAGTALGRGALGVAVATAGAVAGPEPVGPHPATSPLQAPHDVLGTPYVFERR